MPNLVFPGRACLFALLLLPACESRPGDSTGASDATTTSTSTTTASTSTSDTSTSTSTGHEQPTTAGDPTTGTTGTTTSSTGELTTTTTGTSLTGTTGTGGPFDCAGDWCAAKDFLNIIINDNHPGTPHLLEIPSSDVDACTGRAYDIEGEADHTHSVTFTAEHFDIIDAGGQINIESTEAQGHTHLVWSDCE